MVEIRPYTDADYLTVKNNLVAAGMFEEVCDARSNLQSMIDDNPDSILVAVAGGEVVGTVYTTPFGASLIFIWRLTVADGYQKQGIGTQLLDAVEKRAKADVKEIWGFIDVKKDKLPGFYTKRGYQHLADHQYNAICKSMK